MSQMQTEMNYKSRVTSDDRPTMMIAALGHGQWMSASDLFLFYHWPARECRTVRRKCRGRVISGNKGYRLTMKAPPEEISHCIHRRRAVAREADADALDIQRIYHKMSDRTERGS